MTKNGRYQTTLYLRLAAFLPSLAVMTGIYAFSAQPSAESSELSLGISGEIVQICDTVFTLGLSSDQIRQSAEAIEAVVRECAHFAEFAILGITLFPALWFFCLGLRSLAEQASDRSAAARKIALRIGIPFGIFYALSDELHQLIVPGRTCQLLDIIIDSAGVTCGLLFAALFLQLFAKRLQKRR